jgi:hypothetical protein
MVDWVIGLADETWRAIASSLGLYALSLRSTCASFHRRVLALEELPVATELARLAVQYLDQSWHAPWRWGGCDGNGIRYGLRRMEARLISKMRAASHRELLGMLDTLNVVERAPWTKRPCASVIGQMKQYHNSLWDVFKMRARRVGKLQRDWNGDQLSDDELVCVLRRFVRLQLVFPGVLFHKGDVSDPRENYSTYTTVWHIAAEHANLKVLAFLYAECAQVVNARTPGGNNALAHARLALERCRFCFETIGAPDKLAEAEAQFAPVFAFLLHLGLDDLPFNHGSSDSEESDSSDSVGSAMDMLDTALGAQQSAG